MPAAGFTSVEAMPTTMAQSDFAVHDRKMIALITKLRALGAEADIDLPKIAVIGNQSAGKSSLVEAISGITVPRAPGKACTRCPMECRLSNSDGPWQCQILLRREFDKNGERIHSVEEERFGPVLYDKAELEEMIRRAQLAILNPGALKESFETLDTTSLRRGEKPDILAGQLQFSRDVICLDIADSDLPNLSFIDLPGIISAVEEGEDERNIDAVRGMVEDHIQGKTLILLTINMRDDTSNQGAVRLARLADEAGDRTIGVLTKADLIQEGEEDGWLAILEGSSHSLRHGYFITKHPSPKELENKISHSEARELEAKFFRTQDPWRKRQDLQSRMGTPRLTKELSNLLGALINQELPKLRKEAKESLEVVREQLSLLPPPPSDNPAGELLQMVTSFCAEVQSLIRGAESHKQLLQKCRLAYRKFKRDIRRTAPKFEPFENARTCLIDDGPSIDSEDEEFEDDIERVPPMYLPDVRRHIEDSLTRELPFNVPFSAKVALIEKIFGSWEDHCNDCFTTIYEATTEGLLHLTEQKFGNFSATPLLDHVRSLVEEQVEKAKLKTVERIHWMLELEYPPFTLNDHYFASYRDKYLARYRSARQPDMVVQDTELLQEALGLLVQLGYPTASEETLGRLHGPDEYEQELIVMAETSAYFHICYKRIIDNIPRVIDHDFLRTIEEELQQHLIKGLALGADGAAERASIYLAEDPQVAARRGQLIQKEERLKNVLNELYGFQVPSGSSSVFAPGPPTALRSNTRRVADYSSTARSVPASPATRRLPTTDSSPRPESTSIQPSISKKPVRATPSTASTTRVVPADAMHDPEARRHAPPGEVIASATVSKVSGATVAPTASRREGIPTPQTAGNAKKQTQKGKQKQKARTGSAGAQSMAFSPAPAVQTALRASASEFTPTFGSISPSQWAPSPTLVESAGVSTRRVGSPTLTELAYGRHRYSDIEFEDEYEW